MATTSTTLFRPGVHEGFFDTLYTYAWFVTFALGFALYALLMHGHPSIQQEKR